MKNQKDVITYGSSIARPEKLAAEKKIKTEKQRNRERMYRRMPIRLSAALWQAPLHVTPVHFA